jgi:hypothetical protein
VVRRRLPGDLFPEIRFDNLTSAVKKVLKGRRRVESDRFVALRSHYLFCSQFTTAGLEGAHEKGGVEGEVGRCRRNHLVPVPGVADLAGRCPGHGVRSTCRASPRPLGRLGRAPERAGRRRVDARAPVIPLDAVAGVRVLVDDLSHGPVPRGTLGRLRLNDDPVSGLEGP